MDQETDPSLFQPSPGSMRYLPIALSLRDRSCAVVGGGLVALQKCKILGDAGARLTVISPQVLEELASLIAQKQYTHVQRAYRQGDLRGHDLAVIATSEPAVQEAAAQEAQALGTLVNVVDRPELCSFIMPALLVRGDIVIAVSTSGRAPGFAAALRDRIAAWLGPEYGAALEIARRLRQVWKSQNLPMGERRRRAQLLLGDEFLNAVRTGDLESARTYIEKVQGEAVPREILRGLVP
ncbi:MAG: precorrin-2 dehydrogenase [Candidatus Binatia bacterium]|nr:MAG: precorrin-2 dehydrogenase [Candidatus Binatia bacterium]